MMRDEVEVTTKYVATVETVQEAFAFVMDKLDSVGDRPQIFINPITAFSADFDDDKCEEFFEVAVSGRTKE